MEHALERRTFACCGRSGLRPIDHYCPLLIQRIGISTNFIIAQDSEYGRSALARRMLIDIAGIPVYVAAPEDVLLAKLRWAKLGDSDRQLRDAAGIISTQGSKLDLSYIQRWIRELHLEKQWQTASEGGF